jgi:hypothetical protein
LTNRLWMLAAERCRPLHMAQLQSHSHPRTSEARASLHLPHILARSLVPETRRTKRADPESRPNRDEGQIYCASMPVRVDASSPSATPPTRYKLWSLQQI